MTTLAKQFAVDLRSLALLRIGLATLLLVDLADRAAFMQAHYTDRGIFSRADAARAQDAAQWSLHLMAGSSTGEGVLFAIAAVFALLLLVGWRTRLVTCVSWVLLVSLQARTPPLSYGADGVLRALLFYAMFLPIAGRWSVDALVRERADTSAPPDEHRSLAAAALTIQIAAIYVITGAQKLADASWLRLEAVFYAVAADHHATAVGLWLARFPDVTRALTLATLLLELLAPLLLLVPIARARLRVGVIAAFLVFHLALGLCLHLGLFSWVSALAWLALLPREAWERARVATREGVDVDRHSTRSVVVLAGLSLALLSSVDNAMPSWRRPALLRELALATSLEQRWNMFVRPMHDGWLVAAALRVAAEAGEPTEIDVLREGAPVSFARPAVIADQHKSMRWRKYFTDMTFERATSKRNRRQFLRFLCDSWNAAADDDEKILRVDLVFMQADDRIDGTTLPVVKKVLASRSCTAASTVNDSAPYFEKKP